MRIPSFAKSAALQALRRVSVTLPKTIGRRRFSIPVVEAIGLGHMRPFEAEFLSVLEKVLPPRDGAFLDVGANIGQTLLKVKAVDLQRRYVGFEPNPACFAYVQRLITDNRFVESTCMPLALGQSNGVVSLYMNSSIDACASTTPQIRRPGYYSESVHVLQRSGDSIVADLGLDSVAMLKIDVEGAELDVLKGFADTIDRVRPIVCLEVLPPLANVSHETNAARLALANGITEWAAANRYKLEAILLDGTLGAAGPLDSHPTKTTNYIMHPATA